MPWFPDFVAGAELARRETGATGQADPVAQYVTALMRGDAEPLETAWPAYVVVLDPYAGEVHGHRQLDGEPVTWPVAVVVQPVDDRSVTFRTYGSQWPPVGRRPTRAAILDPDPDAEPGVVVTRYLTALAAGDRDGVVQTFTADGDLREPIGSLALDRGTDELAEYFSRCFAAGGGIDTERCCVTDDGVRCALEHNCVRWGGSPVPAQAGLIVFERDAGGLLAAARCYDDLEAPVDR